LLSSFNPSVARAATSDQATPTPTPNPETEPQGARAVSKDIAGKGVANPTALTLSTSMMLRHLGLHSFSDRCVPRVLRRSGGALCAPCLSLEGGAAGRGLGLVD